MESIKDTKLGGLQSTFSRRNLLKGAAALAAAASVPEAYGRPPTGAPSGTVWLYIGTYTGAVGAGGNGEGIYLCELNLFTGKLTVLRLVAPGLPATGTDASTASPSTLAIDPGGNYLYAGNEIFTPNGSVSAYSINRMTGDLTLLNALAAVGAPAHVSVDKFRRYLFAAEYVGSYFEVFPILANGSLGPAVFQMKTVDNVDTSFTTKPATSAPPGSFAISAHEGPDGHPHQMETDPSNQWVVGTDAGQDRIYVWKLTMGGTPPLTPAAIPFVNVPPGDGPRHFAFHPNGVWLYSIQEEGDTIIFWRFDPVNGSLTNVQQVSSLPPGFVGTVFTSEIRVSADGRFVYGVNRLSDTICVFRIGPDGTLTQVSHTSTLGDYPRIITIDPFGLFMVSGNQRADNITTFRISRQRERDDDDGSHENDNVSDESKGSREFKRKGSLTFTGNYTAVGSPSGIVFLI
jgi:6-phosphogluconolactonase (cycloisomerase 2 family)